MAILSVIFLKSSALGLELHDFYTFRVYNIVLMLKKCKRGRLSTAPLKSKGGFYFHTEEDYKFKREADIKIIYQNGNVETSKYAEILGPFYWDVNDYVSIKTRKQILSNRKKKQSVVVGVPTYNSEDHIYRYLIGDKKQRDLLSQLKTIKKSHPDWDVELVVNITIRNNEDKTELIVKKIQREALEFSPSIKVTIITMTFRTKVNAMNAIAEYAKKKKATILCFVDDDTLHCPQAALLSNIEALLHSNDLSIVTSRYDPGSPNSIWERMRSLRWRYHINMTIPGESMVLDVESYPKIPYYLNSDDLYLTSYFLDVDAVDPLRRVIVNEKSSVLSRIAGDNILDGLKVLRRSSYGINQLLSFMPSEKRDCMHKIIGGESIFSTLALIKSRGNLLDAFLLLILKRIRMSILIMIQIELFFRKCFCFPKRTISYDRDPSTVCPID